MTTPHSHFLKNHFLIAMPSLNDSVFGESLTLICEHSEEGAMGLIINHPTPINLHEIFDDVGIEHPFNSHLCAVMSGGPVDPNRGFVLHTGASSPWQNTLMLEPGLFLTSSTDILRAIAVNEGPEDYLVALGYAGWGPGQLEEELAANAWLTVPMDARIIFETPSEQRLHAATALLGIDLNLLGPAGHA